MMNKFMRAAAPFAALAMMGAVTLSPALAQDLKKVHLRLAYITGGVDAPTFVAAAKGYFKEQGLDVEIVDGNGSTGTIQAVGSGDFDIGIASLGATAQAQQASGANDIIAVAGLLQKDPSSIVALKGSGIVKPKDIEGKRFGTDAGNLQDGMITAFAEANGIDMSKVETIIINSGEQVALLKGDIDFVNVWANPDGDKIAKVKPIEKPILFADYGVNILGSSVIVRKDYLAKNPEVVRGFLAALTKGKADVDKDPEGAADIIMAARPDSDRDIILGEIKVMPNYRQTAASKGKPFGWVAPEDIKQTISLLEKYSGMKPGLTPELIYDGSYLPQ
ncbi:MAG TPA: ABC transporter substrate-binding protein [Kaistia sp.]|nr:ABC transporter substrate-binding protein [Kaistia sp.]